MSVLRGRKIYSVLAFALVVWLAPAAAQENKSAGAGQHVNPQRLRETLEKLSEFGRKPDGGVTRLGFSEADMAAREYAMGLMRAAGLTVRVDAAGNIFGHREGTEKLPVLLFGSHIDSVLHGGNFDGDVGSMGAIEVIRALNDNHVTTRHPLEVIIWTNEEGNHFGLGTFGSSAASGKFGPEVLARRGDDGLTLADWLRRYGQDPARFAEARIVPGALAGYLELHIEQGGVLDEAHIPIGVVQGIVGIKHWKCAATGFANHAGTTPMNRRQDALAAAARAALAVRDEVRAEPGRQVGTVGYMKIEPGAVNVIPGRVEFPVELRDLDPAKIERIWNRVEKRFAAIGREENVDIHCALDDSDDPASSDPEIQALIRKAAEEAGLATMDLPSGAGQDAQEVAKVAPMGMIFVPSRGGISHSPKEFSTWEDVANGAEVLYRAVLMLDQASARERPAQ
jgi:beta-ureidopropionase / N-carbamoyl-L-amino-acid hydrolase